MLFVCFFPETCRTVVGNGSIPDRGVNRSLLGCFQGRHGEKVQDDGATAGKPRRIALQSPLQTLMILTEKESYIFILYNSLFYTGVEIVTASLPHLYQQFYSLDTLQIGLCYISMGMGSLVSSLTMGHVADWNFRRHAVRLNLAIDKPQQVDLLDFPIEIARLQVAIPGHIIATLAIMTFGWTINFKTHLAAPEIAFFLVGFGISTAFNIINTLLIDLHHGKPVTATAAVRLLLSRSPKP